MPGYLNRFIDINLSEYGEGCFVRIHNPKVVPQSMIDGSRKVENGPDGKPLPEYVEAAKANSDEILCRVIKDWKVYDATAVDADEQPLLELPVTPELLAKLPVGIKLQIAETFSDAMPSPK